MPYTQVSNLDFEDIKASLKEYLRGQSDFTDYDFEGSAMATLLDTLAYNTYYTAFNTNMVVNELFIDSATLRDNVVALAKQLGYRPKSATSPIAYVSFTVTYANPTTDTELILKAGTGFISNFDNVIYNFVTTDDKFMQLGIWNYKKNHELPPHFHNEFERKSHKTNEFVFVAKGKLQSDLYSEQGEFIETVIVEEGEGILLHNHAHHYKILEDSIILESKNGPFMGVEKDKTVINVKKSKN